MTLSVIVPVLDEERRIGAQLASLHAVAGIDEIVVVDGGSRDATVAIARRAPGVQVLSAARGRGGQLNAGARAAHGDVLLFLHADALLPPEAAGLIAEALAEPGVVAGAFRVHTVHDGGPRWLRPLLRFADVRSRLTRLPYGDQALFVRRAAFERVGGFPDQPLMEDVELARRLRRVGRIRTVAGVVRVSGRRFAANPVRAVLAMRLFPLLYRCGVSSARLARLYGDPR